MTIAKIIFLCLIGCVVIVAIASLCLGAEGIRRWRGEYALRKAGRRNKDEFPIRRPTKLNDE